MLITGGDSSGTLSVVGSDDDGKFRKFDLAVVRLSNYHHLTLATSVLPN